MATRMQTEAAVRERNLEFIGALEMGQTKKAADAVNDFTRTTMREEGYLDKIMEPIPITNDELTRRIDSDMPWIVIDKEPGSPAALTVGNASLAPAYYIGTPRYAVQFARTMTDRFIKDINTLRTYHMDVRQVISDNALKDLLAEKDGRFLAAVNTMLGSRGSTPPLVGTPLYVAISGPMGRVETQEMLKVMNRTPFNLEPACCLTNFISWKNFNKWGRDEIGGDMAERFVKEGNFEEVWLGKRWIVTIKQKQVVEDTVYMFAPEKFLGKNFELDPVTMFLEKKAWMVTWQFYANWGQSLASPAATARVDFI